MPMHAMSLQVHFTGSIGLRRALRVGSLLFVHYSETTLTESYPCLQAPFRPWTSCLLSVATWRRRIAGSGTMMT